MIPHSSSSVWRQADMLNAPPPTPKPFSEQAEQAPAPVPEPAPADDDEMSFVTPWYFWWAFFV